MKFSHLSIPGVMLIEPDVFGDDRGYFYESYNHRKFTEAAGVSYNFVQDNHSRSVGGVLRGMHYQHRRPQGKLVRVTQGEVFDVAVDLRRNSTTFGKWVGEHLSSSNRKQLWIPPGFAHGFLTLSDTAEFLYKTTDFWQKDDEYCISWDDPQIAISWPSANVPLVISAKDRAGLAFDDAPHYTN
jgi:dTDP-4-dehydrorhamnose 3,5-epimerase